MPLVTGARLGPYEIVAPLGVGGMGEVYRARDTKLNRDVAIKVLLPAVANDPDRLARFSREAQVLASLNHPNIAHIYGIEDADGVKALVLELVEGEDLAQRIARGPIPLDEALPIARQIAEALEAAHEHGIIHRDLKPANIKVRPDGAVKVLDFGLAKAIEGPGGSGRSGGSGGPGGLENSPTLSIHATQAGIILGTAAYMSPEQARGKAVDRRTDIWAFGCVLFEMLGGTRAFPGDDVTDTIVSVVTKEPDWNALAPTLPVVIRRLLRRCLEKEPKRRLDSAAAVRIDLDEALTGSAMNASVADVAIAANRALAVNRWTQRLTWGLVASLLAVVVSLSRREGHPPGALMRFTAAPPFGATRPVHEPFAVAPDGRAIAFRANQPGGVPRIFIRRFDEPAAHPVVGTDDAAAPFWSPDSRSLAFSYAGGLYRTDLDGSAPRRLCDASAGGRGAQLFSGTWGTRGVIVFASAGSPLMRVPDSGGTPTPVTSLDASSKEVEHASPWFLPDGRHVLFFSLPFGQTRGVIWATSIDNPARTRVTESSGGAAYAEGWLLTTTPPPRSLVVQPFDPERLALRGAVQSVRDRLPFSRTNGSPGFSVSLTGALAVDRPPPTVHQLTWMDRFGRELATVGPAAVIPDFALAPDERHVVANVTDVASLKNDLWIYDSQRADGARLTFQGATRRPMWALDSRHVYFNIVPNLELRTMAIGASEPQRVDNAGDFMHFEDITRDGRYLVVKSLAVPYAVWIQRVGVPAERRALVHDQFSATQARVSPDGHWLAFTLELPRGPEVFVQPFDRPGERYQISRTGGTGAIWRDDNRELYYEGTEGLMAVAISERGGALDVGTPQKLFPLHTQGYAFNLPHNVEVAANGQKFLVNTIVGDSDNVPIEVTLNWTAGLKK